METGTVPILIYTVHDLPQMLDARFNGPAWLTGGVLGTEASFLMYPAIALLWLYVWRRYRANRPLRP